MDVFRYEVGKGSAMMREIRDVLPTPSPPMYRTLKADVGEEDEDDDAFENSLIVGRCGRRILQYLLTPPVVCST